jgi:hypothetical protein
VYGNRAAMTEIFPVSSLMTPTVARPHGRGVTKLFHVRDLGML